MGADLLLSARDVRADDDDLRCQNPACDLYHLKLEPDEVEREPGEAPDRCAECGGELAPYTGG